MYRCIKLTGSVCLAAAMGLAAAGITVMGAVSDRAGGKAAEIEGTELPVIMYHGVTCDSGRAGEYTVTKRELEGDIERLLALGYTPVTCEEAADYVLRGGELPQKPVVLSFDDGCFNNLMYVYPMLEKYDIKGVFAVTGKWTELAAAEEFPDPRYSYMDADDIRTLVMSGRCEIAAHGYDMHVLGERRGMLPKEGESDEDYRRAVWGDLSAVKKLIAACGQEEVTTLAYPYGFYEERTEEYSEQSGFEVTLSCEEGTNRLIKGDSGCLRCMKRYNRASGRDVISIISEQT